ncbi:MAG: DUF192 domain-containing protein, partial [Candidatus Poseidoniales archaeon]
MEQRAREMGKTSEAAVYRKFINQMKEKTKKMNEEKNIHGKVEVPTGNIKKLAKKASKRIDADNDGDVDKDDPKEKGMGEFVPSPDGKKKITTSMKEEKNGRCPAGQYYCYTDKKCKPIPRGFMVDPKGMLRKENGHSVDDEKKNGNGNGNDNGNGNGNGGNGISEEGLRDWFGKSRSKDGKKGWVQVVSGKPCARQPGQKSTPKCVSSAKRASMSKSERASAQRRKRAADPGQPQKTGAAKPTYVPTDKPKKKMSESTEFVTLPLNIEIPTNIRDFNLGLMFRESLDTNSGMLFIFDEATQQSFHMTETRIPLDIAFITADGLIDSIKELEPLDETPVSSDGDNVICAIEVNRGWFAENDIEVGDEIDIEEGKKDACYHKVKSRYSVWPSAYASGALVKCRKVGAANWGNKSKKEAVEYELDEKCWKGYEKKGMKTMFGKRYPNCVKKEEAECMHNTKGEDCPVHGKKECPSEVSEAVRVPAQTGNIINAYFKYRTNYISLKMFFPQTSKPSKGDVQDAIEKVYPGARLLSFQVSD